MNCLFVFIFILALAIVLTSWFFKKYVINIQSVTFIVKNKILAKHNLCKNRLYKSSTQLFWLGRLVGVGDGSVWVVVCACMCACSPFAHANGTAYTWVSTALTNGAACARAHASPLLTRPIPNGPWPRGWRSLFYNFWLKDIFGGKLWSKFAPGP